MLAFFKCIIKGKIINLRLSIKIKTFSIDDKNNPVLTPSRNDKLKWQAVFHPVIKLSNESLYWLQENSKRTRKITTESSFLFICKQQ